MSLGFCLYLAVALFSVGVYGVLSRQNLIVILMSLELMLNAVNLALIAFGRAFFSEASLLADPDLARTIANIPHVFVLIILAVAAAEAAVGLSILLAVYRQWRSTNASEINLLRG